MCDTDLELTHRLCTFIEQSPCAFHAVDQIAQRLDAAGFVRLHEAQEWRLAPASCAYVVRNDSSIVAFRVGSQVDVHDYHLQICATHSDSPMLKVKDVAELDGPANSLRLAVEVYGSPIEQSWLDRPLGLAGRVMVREADGRIASRLVASNRDVALIPNVAIHQMRELGGGPLKRNVDLCPLFSAGDLPAGSFDAMVADLAGVTPGQVLARDLYLYNRSTPRVWGWANEFVSAPRLDDLQCAFAGLEAFVQAGNESCIDVYACFDNEEVGSGTRQGALSTFLRDTLVRVNAAMGGSDQDYLRAIARSFMASCDNAHAAHPNHPELYDERNRAKVNGGVVVKEAANQKYATDALGRALFAELCARAKVPTQTFANRSDLAGGSTLGNLSERQVSVTTVDVGLAQLAMHSSYETAGVRDTGFLVRALRELFAATVCIDEADGNRVL